MTTRTMSNAQADALLPVLQVAGFRAPDSMQHPTDLFTAELGWDPDLSTADQATLDTLIKLASTVVPMTSAQYASVRAQMQRLRDGRQLGRNAFMALTAADRDRMIYDALFEDVTIVVLAMLRD